MTERIYRQERPTWCPHADCIFRRRAMDAICGGELPAPADHDGVANTHRVCLGFDGRDVIDLQVNTNDLDWFRWIFDALDGKATSWLSQRPGQGVSDPNVSQEAIELARKYLARETLDSESLAELIESEYSAGWREGWSEAGRMQRDESSPAS